jgi:two-component system, OmpR family, response regulator
MSERRVVVIEDDRDIAELVRDALTEVGYAADVMRDGVDGLERALDPGVDLVVLDLMLPGLDGLEICRRLRAVRPDALVLMLTAKATELDRVLGLELGADDYLTKPFSLRELQARVKALFRRRDAAATVPATGALEVGALSLDLAGRAASLRGEPVHLTQREFDLLAFLARHPGQVFSRHDLLDRIWGAGFDGFAHTVNSHINRLRTKVERDPAHPTLIQTVWGRGYKLVPPSDDTP